MLPSKRTIIILHDLFMAGFAWQFSWWARFNFEFPFQDWRLSVFLTPIVMLIQGGVYSMFKLYRGMWRFASVPDLLNILRAAALGALCITLAMFILFRLEGVPRSILILYPMVLVFCLGAPRLGYRFLRDRRVSLDRSAVTTRVLIVGAGRAGEMVVREMLRDGRYFPVGFVDDKPDLRAAEIQRVRVLGGVDDIPELCRYHRPDIVVIAVPSAGTEQMRRIVERCEEAGVPMRMLPGLSKMVAGAAVLNEIREVSINDLLGREKVHLDRDTIAAGGILGRTIMVSGAGGSIGAELCRQIHGLAPARLVLLDRSEFGLYRIHHELLSAAEKGPTEIIAALGDVCDTGAMDRMLATHRPQVLFHAAAYKHVPLLEDHCREAALNNVFGTLTLADAARAHACDRFVLISTDKAVNPASVLGASKRVAELVCEARNAPGTTRFITVRFGNVLGSDGSVIPIFQSQIRRGGPVTVTHPDVTRYFMTNTEACGLILQAAVMGNGGEIFVLDMGEPVRIAYLAEQMIRLTGAVPGPDIRVEYTGLRRGEKLSEELFHDHEQRESTAHPKIFLARHPRLDWSRCEIELERLRKCCHAGDAAAVRAQLWQICGLSSEPRESVSDNEPCQPARAG
ncbi:MAG: polysaccharide biosynthesis protein [Gammaproteobacteria bacterium]|nr:polysaccharide biosynthesis protein [Gammaproteobacteria bacterium]